MHPSTDATDDAYLLEIARNSDFHDEIRDALADHMRMDGLIVATEVNFALDGTNIVARAEGGYLTIAIQKTNCRILDMARFLMLESPPPQT